MLGRCDSLPVAVAEVVTYCQSSIESKAIPSDASF
jgi:hypothetical protein